jgi:hypothetical protein
MNIIKIAVTQDDINNHRGPSPCPIDAAVARTMDLPVSCIATGRSRLMIMEGIGLKEYQLPLIARDFVIAHDEYQNAKPIEFELDLHNYVAK